MTENETTERLRVDGAPDLPVLWRSLSLDKAASSVNAIAHPVVVHGLASP